MKRSERSRGLGRAESRARRCAWRTLGVRRVGGSCLDGGEWVFRGGEEVGKGSGWGSGIVNNACDFAGDARGDEGIGGGVAWGEACIDDGGRGSESDTG